MVSRPPAPPKRTVICFVRHGTTPSTGKVLPGRAKGLFLSDQGIEEAKRAGEYLAALNNVSAIYSSPLERARQTAKEVSTATKVPVQVERGLLECEFGEWTGKNLADLRKLPEWQTVIHHPSGFRFPDGESFGELRLRIAGAVERLVKKHPGEVIVAVSHADPIKIAIGEAMGVPLDLVQRTFVSPASISVVSYSPTGPSVLAVNFVSGLAKLGLAAAEPTAKAKKAEKK